jgi:hypothetical protein
VGVDNLLMPANKVYGYKKPSIIKMSDEAREIAAKASKKVMEIVEQAAYNNIEINRSQAWAINQILDRGMGRPNQAIDISMTGNNEDQDPSTMTTEQLNLLVRGKGVEFIASLYKSGKLQEIVNRLESGWEPGTPEIEKVVEVEKVVNEEAVE